MNFLIYLNVKMMLVRVNYMIVNRMRKNAGMSDLCVF